MLALGNLVREPAGSIPHTFASKAGRVWCQCMPSEHLGFGKKKKRILRTRCIFIRLGAAEHGTPSHPQSSSRLACANKRFKRLLRFSSPTRNLKLLILNTCTVAWLRAAMEHRFLSTMSRHTCKGQLLSNT